MKFGKDFRNHLEVTLPDWKDKYLAYKALKKLIKNLPPDAGEEQPPLPIPTAGDGDGGDVAPGNWFARVLDLELQKLNDFYMEREEWYIIRLQVLKERIEQVKAKKNDAFTSKIEFKKETLEIRRDFVLIHSEMILLQTYSSINFVGLVKILKKYDKRTGSVLSLPFTQRARHEPFFTTTSLTMLVRECEANLEVIFLVQEEELESCSSSNLQPHSTVGSHDPTISSGETETSKVYRSTLTEAIEGLKKASSTYNAMSLSRFFHGEDDEARSGAITSESSLSLTGAVKDVMQAIRNNKPTDMHPDLYKAVMDIGGFVEEHLLVALGHLIDHKAQGANFVGMSEPHRILWLRTFLAKYSVDPLT